MPPLSAYTLGSPRHNIDQALRGAGLDPAALKPADLAPLEDFHTLGRLATSQLAQLCQVRSTDRVLDAGTAIGGTARYLASEFGCHVTGIDLNDDYIDTARWLNAAVGLSDQITIVQGDVTDLPFDDSSFDVIFSQHVQMNVPDKARLYAEAYRVLAPVGRLAIWDVTGTADQMIYPVPWANEPADSHIVSADHLRASVEDAGFHIQQWKDLTGPTSEAMRTLLSAPPNPLGLQVFVADFPRKIGNLARSLGSGSLQVIQAIAIRPAQS
jgi:sarcosine/dimethylglycine N-methyltransferase